MKKCLMQGVTIACGLMLLASAAWADKAKVEKQAKEAKVTLSLRQTPVTNAIGMIGKIGGIAIKTTDIPKDAPLVTLDAKQMSVLDAVKIVTKLSNLTYTITDDGIVVSGKKTKDRVQGKTPKGEDPFAK
jgi:hypothetical protein